MDDDEKKKSVAFAVKFLKNFDVMKDIRDNTWPALVHGAFSKAAQRDGLGAYGAWAS